MGSEGLQERYINPYTDFGFKKLFGTEMNKDLLISFLNALLSGREHIHSVSYLNSEHLGTQELDRRAVFDVYCINDRNERFIVEMQRGEQQFFKDRSVYYSTFPIREQAPKGSWDYELKGVYVISILNFVFADTADVIQHVQLVNLKTKEVFYDKLTYIYLEMPKFDKSEDELDGMLDKWLFVLKNLSGLMSRPVALQERVFTKLFEAAEIARFDHRSLLNYQESLKNYRDWYSVMKTAEIKGEKRGEERGLKKGLKQGLQQGLEQGLKQGEIKGKIEGIIEGKIEVAKQMLKDGLPLDAIIKYSGLSKDDIEGLL